MKLKNDEAEIIRIRYKYRSLILRGSLSLPHDDAAKLIGPDSAYHLYQSENKLTKNEEGKTIPEK